MKKPKVVTLLATLFFSISVAHASTVYDYTGNPFTVQSGMLGGLFQEIKISLTFEQPLPPSQLFACGLFGNFGGTLLDWMVSDGLYTFGPSYFGGSLDSVIATDASGRIASWYVVAQETLDNGWLFADESLPNYDQAALFNSGESDSSAYVVDSPGTWSGVAQVPEPGSSGLMLIAVAVGFAWRRKRARE